MPIHTHRSSDGQTLTICIDGRFDFSTHQVFRNAYEQENRGVQNFVVDLSDTTYLDSSALGMLLLLRDFAGGDASRIELRNCNNDVQRILTISNFGQLFAIK
jgi:anti-anti-sigma factor